MTLRCFVLILCITSVPGNADEKVRDEALTKIQHTQRQLDQQELRKSDQLSQLRQLELERMQLESERDQLTKSLSLSLSTYERLNNINQQMRNRLDNQLKLLEKITLISYIQHTESPLKILAHIDDIDQWYRNLTYYKYITAYQLSQLATTDANIHIQEKLLKELIATKKDIEQQQQYLDQRLASLRQVEQDRKNIISTLSGQIQQSARQLEQLNYQLARVDKLTTDLNHLQPDEVLVNQIDFQSLQGGLPMPTDGSIKQQFSDIADDSSQSTLHHKGIVIDAAYGSPVKAIARGHVVFSDWIRGFGLVIIIDHGHDYLSLYAHNQQLLKQAGDWVDAGETISLVGETGGRKTPELYFELRHKSIAVNPKDWLAAS